MTDKFIAELFVPEKLPTVVTELGAIKLPSGVADEPLLLAEFALTK